MRAFHVKHDIRRVSLDEISPLFAAGKREGLLFVDDTQYAALYEGSNPRGYCGLKFRKGSVVFRNLWVSPDCRGRGYGEALIAYQKEWATQAGYTKAIAYCTALSINLYRKQGGVDMPHPRFHDVVTFDLGALA